LPGVEWTKIQDLNPNAKATNSVVKQKWAVVIGAAKFKEHRLDSAEPVMDKAAKEFYDYLVDPHGGRFEPDHVRLLLNASATQQNIMSSLGTSFLGTVAQPDDLVTVFIATQGFPTTDGGSYLCAYDCALDNIYGTCISIQNLMQTLRDNVKSDRIVLVLQACYSGAAELNSGAKAIYSGSNIDLDKVVLGNGYIILSSSKPDQLTWGDTFSASLIKALKKQDGLVSLQKAFAEAQQETVALTKKADPSGMKKQTPVMKSEWKGNDLVIGTPPLEKVSALPESVLNHQSAEADYLKASNFLSQGKLKEAEQEYATAVQLDPQYADAWSDYGALTAVNGDWQKASGMYEKALALKPKDALFHANYARVLSKLDRGDEAKQHLETAYSLNPKDRIVLMALSSRSLQNGDPDAAVRYLTEATLLYPSSADLQTRLSYALAQAGDVEAALAHAKEAVRLEPGQVQNHLNLASTMLMNGMTNKAVAEYKEAIKVAPTNPDAHFLLSKALEKLGDRPAAKEALQRFVELCPGADARIEPARAHLAELSAQATTR